MMIFIKGNHWTLLVTKSTTAKTRPSTSHTFGGGACERNLTPCVKQYGAHVLGGAVLSKYRRLPRT